MRSWETDWKERFEALPKTRQVPVIRALKEIIREMHEEGYAGAEIGRLMDKDHTTIVHHLFEMGFRPREERKIKNKDFYDWRLKEAKRRLIAREAREATWKETQQIKVRTSLLYQQRREQVTKDKEKAREMYVAGVSLFEIAQKLNRTVPTVHYLIFYSKGGAPKRRRNFEVEQMDLKGNIIARHPSARAAEHELGLSKGTLNHAMTDGRYHGRTAGFMWRRVSQGN